MGCTSPSTSRFAFWTSLGPREIFWYGHSLIINPSTGMYQEKLPCRAMSIDRFKIDLNCLEDIAFYLETLLIDDWKIQTNNTASVKEGTPLGTESLLNWTSSHFSCWRSKYIFAKLSPRLQNLAGLTIPADAILFLVSEPGPCFKLLRCDDIFGTNLLHL